MVELITNSVYLLSVADVAKEIATFLCLWLDDMLYSVAAALYDIFIAFTSINILDEFPQLASIGRRIMLLIGIFMLFVVSFSLIKLLLDPDKVGDKEVGASAIVKNIFIALAMIAVVNPLFDFAYDVQARIIDDQLLEKIILGVKSDSYSVSKDSKEIGQQLAWMSWMSFFNENDGEGSGTVCLDPNAQCGDIGTLTAEGIVADAENSAIIDEMEANSVGYNAVSSSLGAIILIGMLLSFTIDIGVRIFKLVVYQMLAPIAIFSYINPSTKKVFQSWIKNVGTTYLDLFIRVIAIYFAIIMISNIGTMVWGGGDGALTKLNGFSQSLAFFLLMIAIFTFAKLLPKLIGDIFGVNLSDTTINPFKKVGLGALLGGTIGGGIGSTFGMVAAGVTGGINRGARGAIGGAVGGLVGGGLRGVNKGSKEKSLGGAVRAGVKSAGKSAKHAKLGIIGSTKKWASDKISKDDNKSTSKTKPPTQTPNEEQKRKDERNSYAKSKGYNNYGDMMNKDKDILNARSTLQTHLNNRDRVEENFNEDKINTKEALVEMKHNLQNQYNELDSKGVIPSSDKDFQELSDAIQRLEKESSQSFDDYFHEKTLQYTENISTAEEKFRKKVDSEINSENKSQTN